MLLCRGCWIEYCWYVESSFRMPLHVVFSFCNRSMVFWTPECPTKPLWACCIFLKIFFDRYCLGSIISDCSKLRRFKLGVSWDGNGTSLDNASASTLSLPSIWSTSKLKCFVVTFYFLFLHIYMSVTVTVTVRDKQQL